jgi:hypothetical protein
MFIARIRIVRGIKMEQIEVMVDDKQLQEAYYKAEILLNHYLKTTKELLEIQRRIRERRCQLREL